MYNELKQDQRVEFCIGELKGKGKIVGKALTEQPWIGGTYIIEPEVSIRNEVYDFTHFVVQEIYLKVITD
jgi:hypothetical protein